MDNPLLFLSDAAVEETVNTYTRSAAELDRIVAEIKENQVIPQGGYDMGAAGVLMPAERVSTTTARLVEAAGDHGCDKWNGAAERVSTLMAFEQAKVRGVPPAFLDNYYDGLLGNTDLLKDYTLQSILLGMAVNEQKTGFYQLCPDHMDRTVSIK